MQPLIEQNLAQIQALCRKYQVRLLEAFGSAARGNFKPTSDVDFLVLFQKTGQGKVDRFFDLLHELEQLLGRKVDLVDITAASNPYFLAEALRHRVKLYAA